MELQCQFSQQDAHYAMAPAGHEYGITGIDRVISILRGIKDVKDKCEYIQAFSVKLWSSFVLTESKKFFADSLPALQADKQIFVWM